VATIFISIKSANSCKKRVLSDGFSMEDIGNALDEEP